MSKVGWIKLHRKILAWELYRDANAFRVFMHFLLNAYYEETKWGEETFKPGDYTFTYDALAVSLGLTVRQIRFAMDKLKKCQNIVTRVAGRFQVVSIVKYNLFTDTENKIVSEMSNPCQKIVSKVSTLKEDNNIINNNLKNNNSKELLQKERGTRLDVNLQLPQSWREYAVEQGVEGIDNEFDRFKNYWTSPNAKKPLKKDWTATWRNWILKNANKNNSGWQKELLDKPQDNQIKEMSVDELFEARGI